MMDRKSLAISTLLFLFCQDLGLAQDDKQQQISSESAISWLGDALAKAEQIDEYSTMMVLRERKNGELRENEFWRLNIRSKPKQIYGQNLKPWPNFEIGFHESKMNGEILAYYGHLRGCGKNWARFAPDDAKIMKYERYPFTEHNICGVAKRFTKFLRQTEKESGLEYRLQTKSKINKRSCSKLEVRQIGQTPKPEFNRLEIYVDDEYQIPVRFVAYEIPETGDKKPHLLEQYTFVNLDLEPAFTEKDFELYHWHKR